jgi:cell division protein FtsQ
MPGSSRLRRLAAGLRPRRVAAFGVGMAILVGGAWLGLRDSSLVAVREVSITGVTGGNAPAIRSALRSAAREMTTLHFSTAQLRAAVAVYPVVEDLRVHTDFPHAVHIRVIERLPVAVVAAGDQRIPAAADGFLLRSGVPAGALPQVRVAAGVAWRVTERRALQALRLLETAPYQLRARVRSVYASRRGLVASVREGPTLVFGTPARAAAKWAAAARVLADPQAAGARYVDLRVPERPAAGGLAAPAATGTVPTAPPAATGAASGLSTTLELS